MPVLPPASASDPSLPGLTRARGRSAAAASRSAEPLAQTDPIARVLVDVALAHLDQTFDYAVPASMDAHAVAGARVKVRFAGRDVDGYLLTRESATDHTGALTPLRKVVSPEPVLAPQVAALAAVLAERYAGTRSDVLRLAVPRRHAATEQRDPPALLIPRPYHAEAAVTGETAWAAHPPGPAYLRRIAGGGSPRAVWSAAPGTDWPTLVAHACVAALASDRGSLIVVPDGRDVARVDAALSVVLGPDQHVVLTAEAGPARRYREFLAVSRGRRRVVLGTRAAAYAPVHGLGLVVLWDDGDDLLAEPRAPYPHARETLLLRAEQEGTAVLIAGHAMSVEAFQLLRTGWARPLAASRSELRARVNVEVTGADDHALARDPLARATRLPAQAHRAIRDALELGPVLVQTPRAGYAAALACERCRNPARCVACSGPLALASATVPPTCRWCGTAAAAWACPECGHRGLRAPVVGQSRTAEELGRSFAGAEVRTSSGDRVLSTVDARPAIVVATAGAEPVAEGGYAAVILLDTWLLLGGAQLRAAEEALRRWANAVALVRPGGRAVVVGDPGHAAIQALVRWDPAGFAEREAESRRSAHLPPASRLATITGEPGAVDDAVTLLEAPIGAEVLGPVPAPIPGSSAGTGSRTGARSERESTVVIRVPRASGPALSAALREVQRVRSARKLDAVRIQVDPPL